MVVESPSGRILCTNVCEGRRHDLRLLKDSRLRIHPGIQIITDTGFIGIAKVYPNTLHPKRSSKNHPLTHEDKRFNREVSQRRILNEQVIGTLKRFRIIADRYRNRRRRFGLRFSLIAGIYNYELKN